jgi:hypothetical protein
VGRGRVGQQAFLLGEAVEAGDGGRAPSDLGPRLTATGAVRRPCSPSSRSASPTYGVSPRPCSRPSASRPRRPTPSCWRPSTRDVLARGDLRSHPLPPKPSSARLVRLGDHLVLRRGALRGLGLDAARSPPPPLLRNAAWCQHLQTRLRSRQPVLGGRHQPPAAGGHLRPRRAVVPGHLAHPGAAVRHVGRRARPARSLLVSKLQNLQRQNSCTLSPCPTSGIDATSSSTISSARRAGGRASGTATNAARHSLEVRLDRRRLEGDSNPPQPSSRTPPAAAA